MGRLHEVMKKHATAPEPAPPPPEEATAAAAAPGRPCQAAGSDERPAADPAPAPAAREPGLARLLEEPAASTKGATRAAPSPPAGRADLPTIEPAGAGYSKALVVWHEREGMLAEQYRALLGRLLVHFQDKPFGLIVTSPDGGEGKTVTSANLAFALAGVDGARTVLVDCDLRRRGLATLLPPPHRRGLADVLAGTAAPQDVLTPTTSPRLSVIHAGIAEGPLAGLVARPEMEDLAAFLRRRYDYVLFDTPPLNALSDAGTLARIAGEALLVVRLRKTRRESVREALDRLQSLHVSLAGVVLTGHRPLSRGYGYGRYYR